MNLIGAIFVLQYPVSIKRYNFSWHVWLYSYSAGLYICFIYLHGTQYPEPGNRHYNHHHRLTTGLTPLTTSEEQSWSSQHSHPPRISVRLQRRSTRWCTFLCRTPHRPSSPTALVWSIGGSASKCRLNLFKSWCDKDRPTSETFIDL